LEAIRKSTIISPTEGDVTEYCIRVCQDGTVTVSIEGGEITSTATAIDVELKPTTLTVSTTAIKLVTTNQTDRRVILIQNKSETNILYISTSASVTAGATPGSSTDGWEVGPGESFNTPSGDGAIWWGICSTGESALVKVGEGK